MTKEYMRNWDKLLKLNDLIVKKEPMLSRYFDIESEKNIGLKVKVYEALKAGKEPGEIPGYMDIFDLLPKSDGKKKVLWD